VISLEKKFIFIHVPKTGGNSISNVLSKYSSDKVAKMYSYDKRGVKKKFADKVGVKNKALRTSKHSSLGGYVTHWNNRLWGSLDEYYKFSVVRNPWERLISLYFNPNAGRRGWDREDFVKLLTKGRHFSRSQCSYFNQGHMNYIIRFESLEEGFRKVCKDIGIKKEVLPKANKSDRREYTYYYDEELVEMVRRVHEEDVLRFGYRFGRQSV